MEENLVQEKKAILNGGHVKHKKHLHQNLYESLNERICIALQLVEI
jgi:hypothetical protein